MKFIDLDKQYKRIQPDVQRRMNAVLESGEFIMGKEIGELETKLAKWAGVSDCISLSSGTDALLIAMMALGIGPGDEVITTPFTFIATCETIALLGAKFVFVDIDEKTYNIDPKKIEEKITKKTKAIIPVDIFGQCADYDAIEAIAKKHDIPVIADACQSFGAVYKGKKAGALGTISCASFFPSKPLGCYGDGGACFTNDKKLAKKMREIRVHGQEQRYVHTSIGVNGRLDTLQAAVLLAKFEIFDDEIAKRVEIGTKYTNKLKDHVVTPFIEKDNVCVYAQYTIQVNDRETFRKKLDEAGVPTAVHYPIPLHLQPVFSKMGYEKGHFPKAEKLADRVVSLPMHPYLDDQTMNLIVETIIRAVK